MENVKEIRIFESESVFGASLRLALPCVMGQVIMVLYNMADTFFMGLTSSDVRMTALSISMPAFMILLAISNLFGIGGAGAISRSLGHDDRRKASGISSLSFWMCASSSAVYSLLVALFRHPLVDLLGGTDPQIHMFAVQYLMVSVALGGVATSLGALMSHLFRAEGRSLLASAGVIFGGILNIVLDPVFMFHVLPEGNEVLGAAAATAVSNAASLCFFIVAHILSGKRSCLSLRVCDAHVERDAVSDILRSGMPAFMMTLCENVSYAFLDKMMSSYGTAVQAGIGVAKKINMLAHSIVRGMAQGLLPLIGYSYASGDMKRTSRAFLCSAVLSTSSAVACMLLYLTCSGCLVDIFLSSGSASCSYGEAFLRILCIGAPLSAFAYTSISFYQAVGMGGRSLVLALLRKGLVDIPMMFILGELIPIYGAVIATPVADSICAAVSLLSVMMFIRNRMGMRKSGILERKIMFA